MHLPDADEGLQTEDVWAMSASQHSGYGASNGEEEPPRKCKQARPTKKRNVKTNCHRADVLSPKGEPVCPQHIRDGIAELLQNYAKH